ncbi:MAG: YfiR family protein [Nitrospinota bacterium]|nr:YfiR family protein [Nitrospinota bacterium]
MNKLLRHLMVVGLLLWGWCAPMASQALAVESAYAASVEHEVKAAFIHNFTKFIDWSQDSFKTDTSPIRIGILGQGPINEPLIKMNGIRVQKRSLEISSIDNLNNAREFHIIFINRSEKKQIRSILRDLKGTGILTIGDMPDFAEQCGIINFFLQSGKVRFEINIEASRQENLQISSKLLRLARIVNTQCN